MSKKDWAFWIIVGGLNFIWIGAVVAAMCGWGWPLFFLLFDLPSKLLQK